MCFIKSTQSEKKLEESILEKTHKAIEESEKINKEYNYFTLISKEPAIEQAKKLEKQSKENKKKGKLFGIFFTIKDCICVKGTETTASSRILQGYKPIFNATAVQRIIDEDGIILGKTMQDEFGFGTFCTNTGIGYNNPKNPFDKTRSTGGSSGGSAGITALASFPHISIAESTGGSIACPASFCGIIGLTPTYGRVSRYGLLDYSNSMDKIGIMSKKPIENAIALETIAGKDTRDATSSEKAIEEYSKTKPVLKGKKIGIIKELLEASSSEVKKACEKKISEFEKQGCAIKETSMPLNAKYSLAVYYIIAVSEASTNLAKYCGMRYGNQENPTKSFREFFKDTRSKNLGKEAKRRIILGTFARMAGYREAYYLKALKTRTLLIKEFQEQFKKFDLLLNPTMPIIAPKTSEIEKLSPFQQYSMDLCTIPANLAGMPHVSIPIGKDSLKRGIGTADSDMPIGLMLTANHFEEKKLYETIIETQK